MKKQIVKCIKRIRTAGITGVSFLFLILLTNTGCDNSTAVGDDIKAPKVMLTSPVLTNQGYSLVTGTQAIISGTAIDDISVTRLGYRLNDGEEQDISFTVGNSVEFEFTAILEPGNNAIVISASDEAENQAELERVVASAVVRYDVIVVGEPDADMFSQPQAINTAGDVTLYWENYQVKQGYLWSAGDLTQLVLPEGHVLMNITGVNSSRVVVGDLEDEGTGNDDWRDLPVIWENGQPTMLPLPAGYRMGGASAINDDGNIAGYVMDYLSNDWGAVLWQNGEPTLISEDAYANDINSSNVVTGSFFGGGNELAFRWDNGLMTPLMPPAGYTNSVGVAINDAGDVVGRSYDPATFSKNLATMWKGTTAISLGEIPGGKKSYRARGINNLGLAVGAVDNIETGSRTAFISEDGRMSLLNHLTNGEWVIIDAFGINDEGQIIALALPAGSDPYMNQFHSLLLDPVDAVTGDAMSVYIPQQSISGAEAQYIIEQLRPRPTHNPLRKSRLPQ